MSQERVGDVLLRKGDLEGALRSYRESLLIRERLCGQDPSNAGWQSDVARLRSRIEAVQKKKGGKAK